MTSPKPSAIFRRACLAWMPRLMADFGFDEVEAAAVLGNAGHESAGLTRMQELRPAVPGSRGGLGAFQWTGPRRKAFEAWLKRKKAGPDDLDATYGFLFRELTGGERKAVAATKAAIGLDAKVRAFEKAYERAGVKHYDGRVAWARVALSIFQAGQDAKSDATSDTKSPAKSAKAAAPASGRPEATTTEPAPAPAAWWERLLGVRAPALPFVGRNRGSEPLFRVQNQLLAAGYTEVGDPDGLWGTGTKTAVAALLGEQFPAIAPPGDWPLSDQVLAAIAKARKRAVAIERAGVTVRDLRERGTTPIKAPVQLVGGGGLLALLGLGEAIQKTGIPERITAVSDQASDILTSLQAALALAGTVFSVAFRFWWLIVLLLGLYWVARGVKWALEIRALVRQGSIRQTRL